ncbi:hypothetical protein C0991_000733 [Blastosporella zonata]|nr:hypothetical protein C0991_000733 [Blastosporella zonata]
MADMNIPDVFNPILSYLADILPPPVYSIIMNVLSHLLAICSLFFNFIISRIPRNPLEWDAQTILPPLITLLLAYFAVVSFYRTTTWMLRTTIFFAKWGTVFAILMAGVGFLLGNGSTVGRYGGIVSGFGNFMLDVMNERKNTGGSPPGSRTQSSRTGTRASDKRKPKPWDSYERHREYEAMQGDDAGTAQKVFNDILGTASKAVKESGWWSVVKGVVEGDVFDAKAGGAQEMPSRNSQSKTKAGESRSR